MESLGISDNGNLAVANPDPHPDGVVTPVPGRLPPSVLELSSLLQTTLEVEVQLELFGAEVRRQLSIEGLIYRSPNHVQTVHLGQEATHRAHYTLTLQDESLGTITLFRAEPFNADEMEALEDLLCAIVYPLRNALTYRRAVEMASRDPLTGVNNRRAMDQALTREIDLARRQGTPLSLLVIDIDHFKRFNDRFGHVIGDDVLVAVVQTIANTIRRSDLLYRFGGEEFVVLASHTDEKGAMLLGERIRKNVAALRSVRGQDTEITVSLGVARLQHRDDEERLFRRADQALYAAKQAGRDRLKLAD